MSLGTECVFWVFALNRVLRRLGPRQILGNGSGGLCSRLHSSQPGAVVCVADTNHEQAELKDGFNSLTVAMGRGQTWAHVQFYHLRPHHLR